MKIIISEAQSDVILQPSLVQMQDLDKEMVICIGCQTMNLLAFLFNLSVLQ